MDQIVATPDHNAICGLVQPMAVTPSTIARSSSLEVMVQPMACDTVTDSTDSAASRDSKLFDNFFAEEQIVATSGHTALSGLVQPMAVTPSTIARSSSLEVMVQPMACDTVTDSTDSAASGDSKLFDNFFAEEQEVKPISKQEAILSHPVQTSVPDTPETFETKRRRLQSACMKPYYIDTGRPPDARVPVIIKNKYTTGSPTW
jgi:hypothetical protein